LPCSASEMGRGRCRFFAQHLDIRPRRSRAGAGSRRRLQCLVDRTRQRSMSEWSVDLERLSSLKHIKHIRML
jgi:hypothetical protein